MKKVTLQGKQVVKVEQAVRGQSCVVWLTAWFADATTDSVSMECRRHPGKFAGFAAAARKLGKLERRA